MWKTNGPFERPHPPHRTSDHRKPVLDAQMVRKGHLHSNLVTDRCHGELRTERSTTLVKRRGTCRSLGSAEDVGTNYVEFVAVDRQPGTNDSFPPAARRVS